MLDVARDNIADLSEYLIGQVLQSRAASVRDAAEFFPDADRERLERAVAGERVQIIKPDPAQEGELEFGTELVAPRTIDRRAARRVAGRLDGDLHRAWGAGEVLRDRLTGRRMAGPAQTDGSTYGTDLIKDAAACRDTRAKTAQVLRLTNV